jgi:hypothetical protein
MLFYSIMQIKDPTEMVSQLAPPASKHGSFRVIRHRMKAKRGWQFWPVPMGTEVCLASTGTRWGHPLVWGRCARWASVILPSATKPAVWHLVKPQYGKRIKVPSSCAASSGLCAEVPLFRPARPLLRSY